MLDCKSCSSPISVKLGLPPNSDVLFDNPSFYRSIVGVLQYLTITRPDLSYAVNQLCQHMHNPTIGHFAGVKRLLRFVKGTITHGLTYTPSLFDLQAYSDSNWAGDSVDKKSTSGYYLKRRPLCPNPLLKQSIGLWLILLSNLLGLACCPRFLYCSPYKPFSLVIFLPSHCLCLDFLISKTS
ncbi:hypothetical protein CsSME_00017662 [Camellia sinensis var. sinensis]